VVGVRPAQACAEAGHIVDHLHAAGEVEHHPEQVDAVVQGQTVEAACGPPAGKVEHHPEQVDAVVKGQTEEAACGPPAGEVEHHPEQVDAVVQGQTEEAACGPSAGEENGQMAQLLVEPTAVFV